MFMLTAYLLDKVCTCQQLHNDYRKNCDCLDEINRQLSSPVIDDLQRMDLGLLHDTYVDLCDDSKERFDLACQELGVIVYNSFTSDEVRIERSRYDN